VTVFSLPEQAEEYAIHGVFGLGEQATSASLAGFSLAVSDLFAAAEDLG